MHGYIYTRARPHGEGSAYQGRISRHFSAFWAKSTGTLPRNGKFYLPTSGAKLLALPRQFRFFGTFRAVPPAALQKVNFIYLSPFFTTLAGARHFTYFSVFVFVHLAQKQVRFFYTGLRILKTHF